MVITYTPDGGGSAVNLAGADTASQFDAPVNLLFPLDEKVFQVTPIVRSANPAVFDRGNVVRRASFTTHRKYADYATAVAAAAAHSEAVVNKGTVTFVEGGTTVKTIHNARVRAEGGPSGGAFTVFSYQIEGTGPAS